MSEHSIGDPVPGTDFLIGQDAYFKSVHGDFAINGLPAKICDYHRHEKESPEFPKGIAISIQFPYFTGPESERETETNFNGRKTWGRIDEIFPLESQPVRS